MILPRQLLKSKLQLFARRISRQPENGIIVDIHGLVLDKKNQNNITLTPRKTTKTSKVYITFLSQSTNWTSIHKSVWIRGHNTPRVIRSHSPLDKILKFSRHSKDDHRQ
eukprot:TRINITY_DN228_c0_g1_i4.p1 TRINITY_DN228_c0_g1~~TRINITY_DN228_c0_g1_i4.p1  ORF type:complete len:109 (+),score=7.11 TRINITY_DN228_c0_g1_i4:104-430(+)